MERDGLAGSSKLITVNRGEQLAAQRERQLLRLLARLSNVSSDDAAASRSDGRLLLQLRLSVRFVRCGHNLFRQRIFDPFLLTKRLASFVVMSGYQHVRESMIISMVS